MKLYLFLRSLEKFLVLPLLITLQLTATQRQEPALYLRGIEKLMWGLCVDRSRGRKGYVWKDGYAKRGVKVFRKNKVYLRAV